MFRFDEDQQKKIAVANLTQLIFFINPHSGSVSAPLPSGIATRFAIEASLKSLGIDVEYGGKGDVTVEEVPHDALGSEDDPSFEFAKGTDLLFDQVAVDILIAAGVRSLLLELVKT